MVIVVGDGFCGLGINSVYYRFVVGISEIIYISIVVFIYIWYLINFGCIVL